MANEVVKPDFSYQWSSGGAIVSPSNVKIQTGWTAEVPPFQWENFLQNRQDNAILHLFQKGISEWDAASNYYFTTSGVRSYVQGSDGVVYVAVQDSLGQNPTTDTTDTYWKIAWIDSAALAAAGTIVGKELNLKSSLAAASTTTSFTADELVVGVGFTGARYKLSSFSKSLNIATVGVGGMDTGAAPTSGYVGVYAIYNPTTGVSALLGVNATSVVLSNVYPGVNMPSGYTSSALISVLPTNGSNQFVQYVQAGREVGLLTNTVLATSTQQASLTSFSIAAVVPRNANSCRGDFTVGSSSAGAGCSLVISGSSLEIGRVACGTTSPTANATMVSSFPSIPIATPQTLYYRGVASLGTYNVVVNVSSYTV